MTCRSGWDSGISSFTEQKTFTDGRIVVAGNRVRRRSQKRCDSLTTKVDAVKRLQAETAAELEALLPSVLDRAFRGEL